MLKKMSRVTIFDLILVALFQKCPKATFSKIKTTSRVALFLSTFSRLAATGSLKKLASIKDSVSFPGHKMISNKLGDRRKLTFITIKSYNLAKWLKFQLSIRTRE